MSRAEVVRRILWAMVEVVLHSEWRRATAVGVHPQDYRRMRDMCGWWRSTWEAA